MTSKEIQERVEEILNGYPLDVSDELYNAAKAYDNMYGCTIISEYMNDLQHNRSMQLNNVFEFKDNKLTKKDMGIVKFAKELALSKDEKILRDAGLKYDDGEYTSAANTLVADKIMEDNRDYLLEIARKKLAADKADKK